MPTTVWRGRLAFGMVSIPVRLYKAARRERMRFHHVYRPTESPAPVSAIAEQAKEAAPAAATGKVYELPSTPPAASAPGPVTVARVRNMPVGELNDEAIEKPQVLKGFEIEKDRYVTFEPRELAAVRAQTSTELGITEFVRLHEIDPHLLRDFVLRRPGSRG